MKKYYAALILTITCLVFGQATVSHANPTETANTENIIGNNSPVSRAVAVKMLSLALDDMDTIRSYDDESRFVDVPTDSWYYKYVNAGIARGLVSTAGNVFLPDSPLTLEQAQIFLRRINPQTKLNINMNEENRNMPISYAAWSDLLLRVLDELDIRPFTQSRILVLATQGTNARLMNWKLISSTGVVGHEGLNLDAYVDTEILVYKRNGEIAIAKQKTDINPIIESAYIVHADETNRRITIFSGGVERTYPCSNVRESFAGQIAQIQLRNGTAEIKAVYTETKTGTVKQIDGQIIDIHNYDTSITKRVTLSRGFKIYSIADGAVKWKSAADLIVGQDIAVIIVDDSTAKAAVITRRPTLENIRVVLSTANFTSRTHRSVSVTSTGRFTVTMGNTVRSYDANEVYTVNTQADMGGSDRVYVETVNQSDKLILQGVNRPAYRGVFEISMAHGGGFHVVNEICLEEYLYSVVPSEMPSSHGLEAAKIQAITARSYAYNQYFANVFHMYGANIDDSTMSQVYNNVAETDISVQAVNETAGKLLAFNGRVISANYFSTSGGFTTGNGDIWPMGNRFPSGSSSYLSGHSHISSDISAYNNLTNEGNALLFFKDKTVESPDSHFPFFRWESEMNAEQLSAAINANLSTRYASNPRWIKTLQQDGVYRSRPISTIGKVTDIEVVERAKAGNILQLKITGTQAAIMVYTDMNIRMLLRPVRLTLNNGAVHNDFHMLPSSFFAFEKTMQNGELSSIKLYGGGYGHGVGMSQNGAKGLIDRGYTYEEVLLYYYPGTEIIQKGTN
jgi:stage II sporulation protein D